MRSEPSVLVVDGSEETREVLRTVLERRGMHVLTAGRASRAAELAQVHHPDLTVLDLESEPSGPQGQATPLVEQLRQSGTNLVLLGRARRDWPSRAGEEFIAKPYHYRSLVRKIEELLDRAEPSLARCV